MMLKEVFIIFLLSISFISWGKDENLQSIKHRLYSLYKENIVQFDGRVIDWQNNAVTHSEGIGYTLFFAVSMNDKKTFYKVLNWLKKNMGLNKKGLIPWLWGKDAEGKWRVLDNSDATDGNMWIAYALLLAYEKWNDKKLKLFALKLIKNIKNYDIYKNGKCLFLIPGSNFFISPSHITINPSYYNPVIFEKFYFYDKDPIWVDLIKQSLKLWYYIYVSPYYLFPDWIEINTATCRISQIRQIEGFSAIRIPIWILFYSSRDNPIDNELINRIFEKIQIIKVRSHLICSLSNLDPHSCKDFLYAAYSGYNPDFLNKINWQKYKKNYYLLALTLFNLIFLTDNL